MQDFYKGIATHVVVIGAIIAITIVGGIVYTLNQEDDSALEDLLEKGLSEEDRDVFDDAELALPALDNEGEIDEAVVEETVPSDDPVRQEEQTPDAGAPQTVTFNLTGQNFSFSESDLTVKKGDTVIINFTSVGGFHDWVVDEFSAQTSRVNTGGKASVQFVAGKAGTFEYYCSVGNHRQQGMVGNLTVTE